MKYSTQSIIDTLKGARVAKGLSQRALGRRTGVPQSHVSKIENGGADIRLSSLIELARALDLDLRLIPRKAGPAVDGVVRSTAPSIVATPPVKGLYRTLDSVRSLRIAYPDLDELKEIQASLRTLTTLRNIDKEPEALRDTGKLIRKLQQTCKQLAGTKRGHAEQTMAIRDASEVSREQRQALRKAADAMQDLRNQLLDADSRSPLLPRPAYHLDDDTDG